MEPKQLDPDDFADEVDEEYLCCICFGVLNSPRSCKNGHMFCKRCIETVGSSALAAVHVRRNECVERLRVDMELLVNIPLTQSSPAAATTTVAACGSGSIEVSSPLGAHKATSHLASRSSQTFGQSIT